MKKIISLLLITSTVLTGCNSSNNEEISFILPEIELPEIVDSPTYRLVGEFDFYNNELEYYIQNLLQTYDISSGQLSYYYYSTTLKEEITYNKDIDYIAASTVKVPVAMHYYDLINEGVITLNTTLPFCASCYEAGDGSITTDYAIGSQVPLNDLLNEMILYSDNSALQIFINDLGGLVGYRNAIFEYTTDFHNNEYTTKIYSDEFKYDNLTNISFASDILHYLYNHIDEYPQLIKNMKAERPGELLKASTSDYEIASKWGAVYDYLHDYGIVFTEDPYLIVILTEGIEGSDQLISDLNRIFLAYNLHQSHNDGG